MALQGTLADLGVVDLVQFPHAGRKTGELVITSSGRTARLYYEAGSMTHAKLGDLEGLDAVVDVVGFGEGAFEFHQEVKSSARTIELDLHRVVMLALKTRDERRQEERQREVTQPADALATLCEKFLRSSPFAEHAAVVAFNGEIACRVARPSAADDGVEELLVVLHHLRQNHPRAGLSRVVIEDAAGTIAAEQLADGRAVVVVADRQVPTGAITVALKKLAEQVHEAA